MKKIFIISHWAVVSRAVILLAIAITIALTYTSISHSQYSTLFSIPEGQQFLLVFDFTVDTEGNIYVTTLGAGEINTRIVKIGPDGEEQFSTVREVGGPRDGQVEFISEIALDKAGNIYGYEGRRSRIMKIDANGKILMEFGARGDKDGEFNGVGSIVLDNENNIYISDFNNNNIQKFDPNGKFLMKIGNKGTGDGQFISPDKIVLDNDGNIYVADSDNHRIQKFDSKGNFLLKFGTFGTGNGQFIEPTCIAINNKGNIHVPDSRNDRIQKFDSTGNFLTNLTPDGSGRWNFKYPIDLTFDIAGKLYLADLDSYRIIKFEALGNAIVEYGTKGQIPSRFNFPTDIALDKEGNIYVADLYEPRVQKFDPNGDFLFEFRPIIVTVDPSPHIGSITLDKDGNIYVLITTGGSDFPREEVLKFSPDGDLLLSFGSPFGSGGGQLGDSRGIAIDSMGNIYVSSVSGNLVQKFGPDGKFLFEFSSLCSTDEFDELNTSTHDLALDRDGNIYVVGDIFRTDKSYIKKFDPNGTILWQVGRKGSGNSEFFFPNGITLDSNGNIYVADSGNHRIQKFDSNGNYLTEFGSFGFETGKLRYPNRIAVGENGNVYVADTENHRVQVFNPDLVTGNDFSDTCFGGKTSGTIVDRGDQNLTITDEPSPLGIFIDTDLSGNVKPALITACDNSAQLTLDAGDAVVLTCGSANVDVKAGLIETLFTDINGFTASGSLPKNNAITFDSDPFMLTASSSNTDNVSMDIILNKKSSPIVVSPGQIIDLIVNDLVTQNQEAQSSFDPTSITNAPNGTFTITATFTSTSFVPIKIPLFIVTKLTRDNLLLNADDKAGGIGATVTPELDNDVLLPGESIIIDFVIGLQDDAPFSFEVDLLGVL